MGLSIQLVRFATVSFCIAAAAAPLAGQAADQNGRSVLQGAYTAAQATKGDTVFQNVCANCHGSSEFAGSTFQKAWDGKTVFTFFDQLRSTMPVDNPGGLSRADYASVVAYILKLNTYPAGEKELPTDDEALKKIRIELPAARPAQRR